MPQACVPVLVGVYRVDMRIDEGVEPRVFQGQVSVLQSRRIHQEQAPEISEFISDVVGAQFTGFHIIDEELAVKGNPPQQVQFKISEPAHIVHIPQIVFSGKIEVDGIQISKFQTPFAVDDRFPKSNLNTLDGIDFQPVGGYHLALGQPPYVPSGCGVSRLKHFRIGVKETGEVAEPEQAGYINPGGNEIERRSIGGQRQAAQSAAAPFMVAPPHIQP